MDCAAKEQATPADLDEWMAHKPPSTKTANCLHACMSETFGAVSLANSPNNFCCDFRILQKRFSNTFISYVFQLKDNRSLKIKSV